MIYSVPSSIVISDVYCWSFQAVQPCRCIKGMQQLPHFMVLLQFVHSDVLFIMCGVWG
jgi:hypothetical protein